MAEQSEPPHGPAWSPGCGVCGHPGRLLRAEALHCQQGGSSGPRAHRAARSGQAECEQTCPLPPVRGPGLTHVPRSSCALGDGGQRHSRSPASQDSAHTAPLGGLTPPCGFKCHLGATPASPPGPARFLMPPWGPHTGRACGNPHLGSGQPPAPSPVECSPPTSGCTLVAHVQVAEDHGQQLGKQA